MPVEIYPDTNDYIVSRTTDQTITGRKTFLAGSATSIPLTVQGTTVQTANLTEWKNVGGAILSLIGADGGFRSGAENTNTFGSSTAAAATRVTIDATNPAAKALVVRGAAAQTANLQEWHNSANTVISQISAVGAFRSSVDVPHSFGSGESLARVTIGTANSGAVGLTIKGVASQGSNLQEWHNSAGGIMLRVGPNGSVLAGASGANHHFGPSVASDAVVTFAGHDGSWKPVVVRAAATQSANLLEFQNSAGAAIARVTGAGAFSSVALVASGTSNVDFRGEVLGAFTPGASSTSIRVIIDGNNFRIPVYAY